jgi:uncharacterized protein YabE (DUF348 family)
MKIKMINNRWAKKLFEYWYIMLGAGLVIVLIGYVSYLVALDRVALSVDGQTYLWKTTGSTVAEVLKEKKVTLKQGDLVEPGVKTKIREGSYIDVIRAFPIKIKAGGKIREYFTVALPVKTVLRNAGVKFEEEDKVKPGLNVVVKPDQTIKVIDVSSKVITKEVVLKPGTEYKKDKNLERGVEEVVRQGKEGLAQRQIKIIYEDGREVNRYWIAEKILKRTVTAIIALGIKPVIRTLQTSRGSFRYVEMKVMVATAYYPGPECCGKYAVYGETYTGKKAGFGLVAVDPRVIPLGTKLYIEGYGKAEAADIGSAIKKNRIDLCYETYLEAAMYGTKKIKVYILE